MHVRSTRGTHNVFDFFLDVIDISRVSFAELNKTKNHYTVHIRDEKSFNK